MSRSLLTIFLLSAAVLYGQHRVDPRNTYHRILCVLPAIGDGTPGNPRRPQYAPWSTGTQVKPDAPASPTDIIGFTQIPTDDGKLVIAEFVARDRRAFAAILADPKVVSFEKGVQTKVEIETALRKFRKDFDLAQFEVVMP